jgi:hypothetical protein
MIATNNSVEKVTFNIPTELKKEVVKLKGELKVSLNTIYKNAIADYVKKQELQKWEQGAIKASKNKEYLSYCKDMGNSGADIYEY